MMSMFTHTSVIPYMFFLSETQKEDPLSHIMNGSGKLKNDKLNR